MKNLIAIAEFSAKVLYVGQLDEHSARTGAISDGVTVNPDVSERLRLVTNASEQHSVYAVSSDCVLYRIDTQNLEVRRFQDHYSLQYGERHGFLTI